MTQASGSRVLLLSLHPTAPWWVQVEGTEIAVKGAQVGVWGAVSSLTGPEQLWGAKQEASIVRLLGGQI